MKYQQAKEIIDPIIMAINTIRHEAALSVINKTASEHYQQKIIELKKEISELKEYKRKFKLLTKNTNITICEMCDGRGGGVDGDEHSGMNEWECNNCQGLGVII